MKETHSDWEWIPSSLVFYLFDWNNLTFLLFTRLSSSSGFWSCKRKVLIQLQNNSNVNQRFVPVLSSTSPERSTPPANFPLPSPSSKSFEGQGFEDKYIVVVKVFRGRAPVYFIRATGANSNKAFMRRVWTIALFHYFSQTITVVPHSTFFNIKGRKHNWNDAWSDGGKKVTRKNLYWRFQNNINAFIFK